jgi:hypothetical protein
MTNTNSKVWLSWLVAGGLASLLVAPGCGKSNWPTGVEAGIGTTLGGQVGSVDVGQADVPVSSGGSVAGIGGAGGAFVADALVATAGGVAAGGGGRIGVDAAAGASIGAGGTAGAGGIAAAGGVFGGGTAGRTIGAGGTVLDGAVRADAALGGADAPVAGNSGGLDAGGFGASGAAGGIGGSAVAGTLSSGGVGGRADAGRTGGSSARTDALPPGTIWTPNWGVPLCAPDFYYRSCSTSSTSICVKGDTYDAYLCSGTGQWFRAPDSCPTLLRDGDVCTGQYTCFYPYDQFCTCAAKGATAACSDVRFNGLLNPPDAAPPPDARQPVPIRPCPADPQGTACDTSVQGLCVLPDVLDVCACTSSKWYCSATSCPAAIEPETPCQPGTDVLCLQGDNRTCQCHPNGRFSCWDNYW